MTGSPTRLRPSVAMVTPSWVADRKVSRRLQVVLDGARGGAAFFDQFLDARRPDADHGILGGHEKAGERDQQQGQAPGVSKVP